MAIKKVFKSTIGNCTYLFESGKSAVFVEGRYLTDSPSEIAELMRQVVNIGAPNSEHPFLFVDEADQEVDTSLQDRIREAQRAATLAVLAEETTSATIKPSGLAALAALAATSTSK